MYEDDFYEAAFCKFFLAHILISMVLLMVYGCFFSPLDCNTEHSTTETYRLVSAVDTQNITGKYNASGILLFYSANGELDSQKFYNLFYQLEDGGIKQYEIPDNEATIYYIGSDEVPHFEITKFYDCNGIDRKTSEHDISSNVSSISYSIYVPKGSIAEQFQFNGG